MLTSIISGFNLPPKKTLTMQYTEYLPIDPDFYEILIKKSEKVMKEKFSFFNLTIISGRPKEN